MNERGSSDATREKRAALLRELMAERAERREARVALIAFVLRTSDSKYRMASVHRDVCRRIQRFYERVKLKLSPRMMLILPPQRGKSHIATQRATVWAMGIYAGIRIGIACYSPSLATDQSIIARNVAQSVEAKSVFPMFAEKPAKDEIVHASDIPEFDRQAQWTAGGSSFVAVGVGTPLAGKPLDVLMIDDPYKDFKDASSQVVRDDIDNWYSGVGMARLSPGGGIMIISTAWHVDDQMARLMKRAEANPDADQWEIVRYPEIAAEPEYGIDGELIRSQGEVLNAERHTLAEALRRKASTLDWIWKAHYECRPSSEGGNIIHREWMDQKTRHTFTFERAMSMKWDSMVASCDLTFHGDQDADFVAMHIWARKCADAFLLGRIYARLSYTESRQVFVDFVGKWKVGPKLVERAANGFALCDDLHRAVPGIIPIKVAGKGSKTNRMRAVSHLFHARNVWLPDASIPEFAWVGEYVENIASFPGDCDHDDDADATSQALEYLFGDPNMPIDEANEVFDIWDAA